MGSHHPRESGMIFSRRQTHLTLLLFCGLSSLIHSVFSQALSDNEHTNQHNLVKRQIDERRVVCYYANWAVYRKGTAKFSPQNINPYLCTHLIYAFAGLGKDDKIQTFDKYQDLEKGGYGQFAALKTYNRDLKTLIAIGGWNEGSRRFSPLVADSSRRKTFIRSAITFLRQYNFDGLDLDWEYPTFRDGGKPEDRRNYAKFCVELREAFELEAKQTGKDRLLLTMAVPASLEYAGGGFDIKTLDKALDFFNLLTYDYHSAYEPATNHHSPLYRPKEWSDFDFRADLNIDTTIQFYINSGASRNKLVLGIPTYGRSYTLVNPDAHEIGSPTDGPGKAGKGTKEDGYLAYYEICEAVQDEDGWNIETPYPGVMGPYANKDDLWVGFDDEAIVREKSHFVNEESLGGIMFWTIDNDDFRGACGDRPFPLIEAAKEALYGKDAAIKTATSVSISTSEIHTVERLKLNRKQLADLARAKSTTSITPKPLKTTSFDFQPVPFDPFSTPSPPTTPSSAPAYECKDEGFFPHTKSCKKYFWCLSVPGSGMVAHTFTCPQGLYFNSLTDGCDFRRNVDCEGKDDTEEDSSDSSTIATTEKTTATASDGSGETLEDVLAQIKSAGGLEAFEEKLRLEEEERETAKRREEERRQEISKKTRGRLSELLNRKRAEVLLELERNGISTDSTEPPRFETIGFADDDASEEPVTLRPNTFRPNAGTRNRLRNRLHEVLDNGESLNEDSSDNAGDTDERTNTNRVQNAARPNIASNPRQRNPALNTESATERPSSFDIISEFVVEQSNRGLPPTALDEPEEEPSVTLRPLEYVTIDRGSPTRAEDNPFVTPLPIQEETPETPEERPKSNLGSERGSVRDLEYVTIQRGSPSDSQTRPEINRFGAGGSRGGIDNQQSLPEEDESVFEDQFVPTTFRPQPPVPTLAESTTTESPNIRASLLFLTNPSLSAEIDEDEESHEDFIEDVKPLVTTSRPPFIPSTTRTTPRRPLPTVTNSESFSPTPKPRHPFRGTAVPSSSFRGSPTPGPIRGTPTPGPIRGTPTPKPRHPFKGTAVPSSSFRGSPTPGPIGGTPTPSSSFRGSPTPGPIRGTPTPGSIRGTPTPRINGLDAFNILQAETERLTPEEQLFLKGQIDNVVTRPKEDPLLGRRPQVQERPQVQQRPSLTRPQSPRRLEQPRSQVAIKSLPPRPREPETRPNVVPRRNSSRKPAPRPTLPRDPVRHSANRARQPSAAITPRVNPFATTASPAAFESPSTPSPVVSLPPRNKITLPARASLPNRNINPPITSQIAQPVQPVSRPRARPVTPKPAFTKISPDGDYIYEYEYVYEDENGFESSPALDNDYDLNPLTSKVELLDNGKPVCHDVGVFPHPGSCRKFITCSRRAVGSGVVGWVYECPSYLAFDPVGGRCNWANEFVCAEKSRL